MNIKTALVSVSDKTGLIDLAKRLIEHNIRIISTGGTAKTLQESGIPLTLVSDFTQFPEIMNGRVKTLHHKVHGGILGERDKHAELAKTHAIEWIDLVICNLYPFADTIAKNASFESAIENIDVGGPAMIRAAAKNHKWVTVLTDPQDYPALEQALASEQGISPSFRQQLAAKAFAHTAQYDSGIAQYLNQDIFPDSLNLSFKRTSLLRYGENPHQAAALYVDAYNKASLLNAPVLQGKALSYNNMVDADAAFQCVSAYKNPSCVIVKHANPCGIAESDDINNAFELAWQADSKSAFGGIVALNRPCTKHITALLSQVFIEVIIAPGFDQEALNHLSHKPNCRVLDSSSIEKNGTLTYRFVPGGLLVQEADHHALPLEELKVVTKLAPDENQFTDLLFAWQGVKYLKSNAILIAKNTTTVGIGCGQVSRIDAVELAIRKASFDLSNCVLASDGFFPFADSIDTIAKAGIKAIIQPGGSIRDSEVIEACNQHGIAMVMTGIRCFNH